MISADDGQPPKWVPLRETGSHRDQVNARQAVVDREISGCGPTPPSSSTRTSVSQDQRLKKQAIRAMLESESKLQQMFAKVKGSASRALHSGDDGQAPTDSSSTDWFTS